MKKQITINVETDKDNDMVKAIMIYLLRSFMIKQKDIKIKELKNEK